MECIQMKNYLYLITTSTIFDIPIKKIVKIHAGAAFGHRLST